MAADSAKPGGRPSPVHDGADSGLIDKRHRTRQGEQGTTAPRAGRVLELLPVEDFLEPHPIAYAIRGVLERDSLAEVSGEAGSYKTFAVISWACAIATGRDWCDRRVSQGPVLLFVGEGRNGLSRRFLAWSRDAGIDLHSTPLRISNMAAAITDPLRSAELVAVVAEFSHQHGPPVLIVFDTLNRNFGPADENSTADMTAAVGVLDELRVLTGACVLVVHHVGHGDKSRGRGSSVLYGALDSAYLVERDADGTVRLTARKMKDAELPEPMAFRPVVVDLGTCDDEGQAVTSAVLRPEKWSPAPQTGKAGRGRHQTTALRLLRETFERHRANLERSGNTLTTVRVTVNDWRDRCGEAGIDRRRFGDLLRTLQSSGHVRVDYGFVEMGEGSI